MESSCTRTNRPQSLGRVEKGSESRKTNKLVQAAQANATEHVVLRHGPEKCNVSALRKSRGACMTTARRDKSSKHSGRLQVKSALRTVGACQYFSGKTPIKWMITYMMTAPPRDQTCINPPAVSNCCCATSNLGAPTFRWYMDAALL